MIGLILLTIRTPGGDVNPHHTSKLTLHISIKVLIYTGHPDALKTLDGQRLAYCNSKVNMADRFTRNVGTELPFNVA